MDYNAKWKNNQKKLDLYTVGTVGMTSHYGAFVATIVVVVKQ